MRRHRDDAARYDAWERTPADAVLLVQVEEGDRRIGIEERCRDALVDLLTSERDPPPPLPLSPPPPVSAAAAPASPPRERVREREREWEGWLLASLADWHGGRPWRRLYCWLDPAKALLLYAPEDPNAAPQTAVSAVRLARVLSVEVETFATPGATPPPVSGRPVGFYLETRGGQKHRFCAASVGERTRWLDALRRAVLRQSAAGRRHPLPYSPPPPAPPPARDADLWASPVPGEARSPQGMPPLRLPPGDPWHAAAWDADPEYSPVPVDASRHCDGPSTYRSMRRAEQRDGTPWRFTARRSYPPAATVIPLTPRRRRGNGSGRGTWTAIPAGRGGSGPRGGSRTTTRSTLGTPRSCPA